MQKPQGVSQVKDQKEALDTFLKLAIDLGDLVASLSTAIIGFSLLIILQAWGFKDNELRAAPRKTWILFTAIGTSCISVVLALMVRMAAVGHFYELGARRKPIDWDKVEELGLVATGLASVQIIVALIGLGALVAWVLVNRQINVPSPTPTPPTEDTT